MDPTPQQPPTQLHSERKKLWWFLGFVLVVLLLTGGTDIIMSIYNTSAIPQARNPFKNVPTTIPTPFFTPYPTSPLASPSTHVSTPTRSPSPTTNQVFCPMDAKLCPDGKTYVGRSGPNCEFVACPKKKDKIK